MRAAAWSLLALASIQMPGVVDAVPKAHRARQREERMKAGAGWEDSGLVFVTQMGTPARRGERHAGISRAAQGRRAAGGALLRSTPHGRIAPACARR